MEIANLDDDKLYTTDRIAEMLDISAGTVRRWIRDGTLPGVRIGRRKLYAKGKDIKALIEPIAPD